MFSEIHLQCSTNATTSMRRCSNVSIRCFARQQRSSLALASALRCCSSTPAASASPSPSASSSSYTFDDFVNEIEGDTSIPLGLQDHTLSQNQEKEQQAPQPVAQERREDQQQQEEKQHHHAASTSTVLPSSVRAPHSLSEFLVRCNELVVDAKRHPRDNIRRSRVKAFWNTYVAKCVEMTVRNGHDLACVARAGRGYSLTIPWEWSEQDKNAVYIGWSVVSRYESMTACYDLMCALALLVRSQPRLPDADECLVTAPIISSSSSTATAAAVKQQAQKPEQQEKQQASPSSIPKPKTLMYDDTGKAEEHIESLRQLHARHQQFALRCIRHYFAETNNNTDKESASGLAPRCPPRDIECMCDVLVMLNCFVAAPLNKSSWMPPPQHVQVRLWHTAMQVCRISVPHAALSLSFSQLVMCLVEVRRLFSLALTTLSSVNVKSDSSENKNRVRLIDTLRAVSPQVRLAGAALLDAIVLQSTASGNKKFINSFHFTEVVFCSDALYLLKEKAELLELLRVVFAERTSDATKGVRWEFSAAVHTRLREVLGV